MTKEMIKTDVVIERLNDTVLSVIDGGTLSGFQKAFQVANATEELKKLLTPEYMKPIMALQGSKLGFKTDNDKNGGYTESVVKNCLIEAVLTGVQPSGNHFNIIAGNMYLTKEGLGYLLANFPGLYYEIIPSLPRINADKTSAAIEMNIKWTLAGVTKERKLEIPVKMNAGMGTDAVIGKAIRKARHWLYTTITGSELPEGDITDSDAQIISTTINEKVALEDLQYLFEIKKDTLGDDVLKNAERIISNKEETSYSKLYKTLQAA